MTSVVNVYKSQFDVYIGRYNARFGGPSMFANPFRIGSDGTRDEVIDKYRAWLWGEITSGRISRQQVLSLKDKRLGCFCKPKACHGDILQEAILMIELGA